MRAMKDSGIEWIGEIPVGWDVVRLKKCCALNKGLSITKADLIEFGSPVISYGQIHSKYNNWINISDDLVRYVNPFYEFSNPSAFAREGDIIFADTSEDYDGIGNCIYVNLSQGIFAGYHTIIVSPFNFECPKYLAFLFQTDCWRSQIRSVASGIKVFSVTQKMLKNTTLLVPPVNEQQRIAEYLDNKCAKIDSIIEKQKAVIEKLKEYKLSVITEAVTKGLNPNVEMKDSGIEWIGKIPACWSILPFKAVLKERSEKNIPIKTTERLSLSIDKGVTLYSEKTTNLDRFKDDVSQYKLAYEGDLVLNSMNMIVGAIGTSNYFGCVSPAYYTYYDEEENHVIARYCEYLLKCKTMRKVLHSLGKGIMSIDRGEDRINTCRLKVSRYDLRSLKIPVPPLDELREVVGYLDRIEESVSRTINNRLNIIDKLKEYKKSLIYEVVTGKKEV